MANVRVKIYLVNWVTDHDGIVESGTIVHMSETSAKVKIANLYCESRRQVGDILGKDEISETNYYVESSDGLYWERAEIQEEEIGIDVELTY